MNDSKQITPGIEKLKIKSKYRNKNLILPSISKSIQNNVSIQEYKSQRGYSKWNELIKNGNMMNVSLRHSTNLKKDMQRDYNILTEQSPAVIFSNSKLYAKMSPIEKVNESRDSSPTKIQFKDFKNEENHKIENPKEIRDSSNQRSNSIRTHLKSKGYKRYLEDKYIENPTEMNITKITQVQIIKNKKWEHPLWGKRAKSIEYFWYDLDLIKQKLENHRKSSFPHLLIMSIHDNYDQGMKQVKNEFRKAELQHQFSNKRVDIIINKVEKINYVTNTTGDNDSHHNLNTTKLKRNLDEINSHILNINANQQNTMKEQQLNSNEIRTPKSPNKGSEREIANSPRSANVFNPSLNISGINKNQATNSPKSTMRSMQRQKNEEIEEIQKNLQLQEEFNLNLKMSQETQQSEFKNTKPLLADKYEYFKMWMKDKHTAEKMRDQHGFSTKQGRGGSCGFGSNQLVQIKDKVTLIKSKYHQKHQNDRQFDSIFSINKI